MEQMTVSALTAWLAAEGCAHGLELPVYFQLAGVRYALVTVSPLGGHMRWALTGTALVLGHVCHAAPCSIREVLTLRRDLALTRRAPVWLHAAHTLAPLLDGLWLPREQIPLLADVRLEEEQR